MGMQVITFKDNNYQDIQSEISFQDRQEYDDRKFDTFVSKHEDFNADIYSKWQSRKETPLDLQDWSNELLLFGESK